jgi:predicted restriction endonuclease
MPRDQSALYKYKCAEPMCGLLIRSDKWQAHIKAKHKFKVLR